MMKPKTTRQVLESKVAIPGFFSGKEMKRSLSSCGGDTDLAAEQLKAKHAFLCKHGWDKGIDVSAVEPELRKGYIRLLLNQTDRDGRPIIHFQRKLFFPSSNTDAVVLETRMGANNQWTSTGGGGIGNDTAAAATARGGRLSGLDAVIACFTYYMEAAVRHMEELDVVHVDGVVLVMDFMDCKSANFEFPNHTLDRELFKILRTLYPDTLHKILVANTGNALMQGIAHFVRGVLPAKTKEKLIILPQNTKEALAQITILIPPQSIPRTLGGRAVLKPMDEYIAMLAATDGVQLEVIHQERQETSDQLMNSEDGVQLNGMQYSGMSAKQAGLYDVLLRGGLYWRKSEGAQLLNKGGRSLAILAGKIGVGWPTMLCLLRPDALLVYDNNKGQSSKTPTLIVPLAKVEVKTTQLDSQPHGSFAFVMTTPGAPTYVLAAKSEHDRAKWLQAIEEGKGSCEERATERVWAEEEHDRMNTDLLGLDGFDDDELDTPTTTPSSANTHYDTNPHKNTQHRHAIPQMLVRHEYQQQELAPETNVRASSGTGGNLLDLLGGGGGGGGGSNFSNGSGLLATGNGVDGGRNVPLVVGQATTQQQQHLQPRHQQHQHQHQHHTTNISQQNGGGISAQLDGMSLQSQTQNVVHNSVVVENADNGCDDDVDPFVALISTHSSKSVASVPGAPTNTSSSFFSHNQTNQGHRLPYSQQQHQHSNQYENQYHSHVNVQQQQQQQHQHQQQQRQQPQHHQRQDQHQQHNYQQQHHQQHQQHPRHDHHQNQHHPQQHHTQQQQHQHQQHQQRQQYSQPPPIPNAAGAHHSGEITMMGNSNNNTPPADTTAVSVNTPPAAPPTTLFPAGLSGTIEFGTQWPILECEAHIETAHQLELSNSTAVVYALVRRTNAQLVEMLEPNVDRPFTEAILAARSAMDGSLCLLHCRMETNVVYVTCRSGSGALSDSVAALCASLQ